MDRERATTILLVEESPLFAQSIAETLEKYDYQIITVSSGEKALEVVETFSEIGLILMDTHLSSGLDSAQTAEMILRQRNLPVVFLVSPTESEALEKTEHIASYGYLDKHAPAVMLLALVKTTLRLFQQQAVMQETVGDSQASLKFSQRIAHVGHWIWDTIANRVTWSEEMYRIFGLSPESFDGDLAKVIAQAIHPEDQEKVNASNAAVVTEQHPAPLEYRVVWPDQSVHTLWGEAGDKICDSAGKIIRLSGIVQDITERKRSEQVIHDSEERYRSLFNTMTEGCALHEIVFDENGRPCDYRFLDMNPAFERLTGLKREDLIGNTQRQVLPTEDPFWFETYCKVALTGESIHLEHYSPPLQRHYEVYAYCPAPGQFAVVFMDITERKRNEEQIQKSLAEKETLLRELYHRTKNNMAVIISLLELQAGYVGDERLQKEFVEAQNRIRSMALVHEKLYETRDLSHINLKEYINDLISLIGNSYNISSTQISVSVEIDDVFVLIDTAIPCGLIVNELISNAIKYAFPNEETGQISIQLYRTADGEINIKIADNGVGVHQDFDFRRDGHLGIQNIFILTENQLQGQVTFDTKQGVACHIQFRDIYHKPRV